MIHIRLDLANPDRGVVLTQIPKITRVVVPLARYELRVYTKITFYPPWGLWRWTRVSTTDAPSTMIDRLKGRLEDLGYDLTIQTWMNDAELIRQP